ncbi:Krr1-domain-containing protein [Mollisia scopiformis]|uniref:Krr1-domain-containing protein n=1 Tax=Mollisia scopiformis TaxID=149040 RepID=A0A194XL95_MOLSC|nr:Krr1-domain-containing protein [Mollisia scopiformis]KUJ20948.1 Krr1-domain-containing protein [Mollisia scopiformis]
MAKRKAEVLSQAPSMNGSKKHKKDAPQQAKPSLLDDSDSVDSSDESDGGAKLEEPGFKINEEFAKRFEHNKKREELQKLEEKYEAKSKPKNGQYGDKYDEDSESSSDPEDEDDEGILATEDLDAQITATLKAIRSKDPRVYNKDVTFYAPIEEDSEGAAAEPKRDKPMHLSDYHRENLLNGYTGAEEEDTTVPRTFAQEQEDLKKSIVSEMYAAVDDSDDEDEDGGFLVPKSKPKVANDGVHPSRKSKVKANVDVSVADKDPETFISNFMAARAWIPSDASSRFQPFESDDEEEDERAEKFEAAYNLRFEDPKGSNEMLKSYARDVVASKSVRREEVSGRKKQRDLLREKKETEKQARDEERAQLRRLKIEEAEEKLQKIKKAAGIRGKALKDDEWTKFLGEDWDDNRWESEMNKRFGDDYYAAPEAESEEDSDDEAEVEGSKKKRKVKKPKWDDNIDIKDLVPEFDDEGTSKPAFTLSDSDAEEEEEDNGDEAPKKSKTSKDRQKEKQEKKKAARIERKRIEELVDSKMDLDLPMKSKQPSLFRYRETSPTSFGLTARDILMAPDASLNEFAGLKKMATFRDAEKKRKDKKHLGKKARLRQWRKETFGNEDGPEIVIGGANEDGGTELDGDDGVDIVEGGRKKKKRSRKSKGSA